MIKNGFLNTNIKNECVGCQACKSVCPTHAIAMTEDDEGFFYPLVDKKKCVGCGLCHKVCQKEDTIIFNKGKQYAFGGYALNDTVRMNSTSGGVFSIIANKCIDNGYTVFGVEGNGLNVFHSYTTNKVGVEKFRKSKYIQSDVRDSFIDVKRMLSDNKSVLFSGTPCQIEGLYKFLKISNVETNKLLSVEVVCEGLPSPLYVKKYIDYLEKKHKSRFLNLDYRSKTGRINRMGKWDFQIEKISLKKNKGTTKTLYKDRWFNPFWYIWLNHLMSRPSCYNCDFARCQRVADITLGDLWGVHLYCPELYGENKGSSLILCNTKKGLDTFSSIEEHLFEHELPIAEAIKYQSPLRKPIASNPRRSDFVNDLKSELSYKSIIKKYYKKPSFSLLFKKYIYGNRQKIFFWKIKKIFSNSKQGEYL